jgi:diphosphomevalonate decarboxylase
MSVRKATSVSCPNLALLKYWGNRDHALRIPVNDSLSMNLAGLHTRTTVTFDSAFEEDVVVLDSTAQSPEASQRVIEHLDRCRALAGVGTRARVDSQSNFPAGTGIASSASGFAALTVAACAALGLSRSERELSILARQGSGSACRSIPAGFVEWRAGSTSDDSYAYSIAAPDHWMLVDCVAIVSYAHKEVGSTGGHALAATSPLQQARVEDTPRRMRLCREALLARDFARLADVVEEDSTLMHAIMMTSCPPLYYWLPPTLGLIAAVRQWRAEGLPACFTIDAGPNVHVLTLPGHAPEVSRRLSAFPGVQRVLTATPGEGAMLINE